MTSRYGRPVSPTGPSRRYADPARTSTGSIYNNYDMPSSYKHRDSFTSPRTSGERVVPISSEIYINGQRVNPGAQPRAAYDAYDSRPRRSTYNEPARAPPSNVGSYLEPAVVQPSANRGVSPAMRPSNHDSDRYISSASTPKRENKKVYSVGDGKTTRLVPGPENDVSSRRESVDNRLPAPPADRSRRDYHLSGPAKRTPANDEGGGYEYTDARGMYRDTEPKWRPRRGSVDGGGRERPSSMIEPYSGSRNVTRDQGPPPATRGVDRLNSNFGRHSSVSSSVASPTRQRDRGYGSASSGYSEDENYRVAPRIMPASRADVNHKLPSERGEWYSPLREDFGGRREPRGLSRRFEDADVTSRGFGIRAPSIEPRRSREDSVDRYSAYGADPYGKPPPRDHARDRESTRDNGQRDVDRREQERFPERDRDRNLPRTKRESPPARNEDPPGGRDMLPRDLAREREVNYPRNAPPSAERTSRDAILERDEPRTQIKDPLTEKSRDPTRDDTRRDRDRETASRKRDQGDRSDFENSGFDKQTDRDRHSERELHSSRPNREVEEQRRPRDTRDEYDESMSHSSGSVGNGLSSSVAVGAAAYGAKQIHDRRLHDGLGANGRNEKPKSGTKDIQDSDPNTSGSTEARRDSHMPIGTESRDQARTVDASPEDVDRPRRRNYIGKDSSGDDVRQSTLKSKESNLVDPEEDYRRRVQQETERVQAPDADADDDGYHESEDGRDRHRRHRNAKATAERDDPDQRATIERARNDDDDSTSDHSRDAQALTRYKPASDGGSETRFVDEPSEIQPRRNRVSIVEPPKEKEKPKGILREPTKKFPEDPNPIREGVAPLKDGKAKDVPPGARWTKINRSMVNPEALEEAQERFEERQEHVIVLRVLTREEIQKFADRTKEIRDSRYERDHKDRRARRDGRHEHEETDGSRDDEDRSRSSAFDR